MTDLGRIGAYRLVAELGRGGTGTVYRALAPAGGDVAVKALNPGGADAQAVTRFLRESQIRIDHANVVRTLGGGVSADGRPYVVQELLRGETLRAAFARMTIDEIVDALTQAARGVGALHAVGLIHRDLKPDNLFRCEDGTLKVLDLGIATWTDQRATLTATGTVVGTPAYLSPEQARGDRGIDARSDVWALGAVLYEGLAGRSPFARGSVLATMLAVSIDPLVPLRSLRPEVPRAVEAIVERCLDRTLLNRFADAGALARALEHVGSAEEADYVPTAATTVIQRARRSVALVLASQVAADPFAALVRGEGGEPILLRDGRAIGLFGGAISRGDETERALRIARGLVTLTPLVALGVGWAEIGSGRLTGAVIEEAEAALARAPNGTGIVCGPMTGNALGAHAAELAEAPGIFEVQETPSAQPAAPVLLGRHAELVTLRRARDAAVAERRPIVSWIVGPAGAGKSRLAQLVPSLVAELDTPMRVREAHAGSLPPTMFSLWCRALDVVLPRPSAEPLDASARADRARDEILDALVRECEAGPIAIVLEDLQWADTSSIELLGALAERLEGYTVWLVVTARPEVVERAPGATESAFYVQPSPLTAADAVALSVSRGHPLELREAQELVERTAGNPLFLDLMLQTLARSGTRPTEIGTATAVEVPPSIEHAVQARMDLLPEVERDAFVRLSLLRWPASAAELGALGHPVPESALDALARRGLVTRGRVEGVSIFRPQSALVAEVAAALPPTAARIELHRMAATAGVLAGRDDEHVAYHLESAGDLRGASAAYLRAMASAVNGGDARKIARCAQRALATDPIGASTFTVHLARLEAARWTGDPEVEEQALSAAVEKAGSDADRAKLESERGDWLRRRGRNEEALPCLDRAIALADAAGLSDLVASASCRRAVICALGGRMGDALAALAVARACPPPLALTTLAGIEDTSGFLAGCTGDHEKRRRAFAEAARLHARAGDLRRSAGAESNSADAANRLGELREAERALRRCLLATRRVGNRLTEGYGLVNLGYTLHALGRTPEAVDAIVQGLRIAEQARDPRLAAAAQLYLCRVDPQRAGTNEALATLAADRSAPTVAVGALVLRGRRALAQGERELANEIATEALRLRDELGALEEGEADVFLLGVDALRALGRDAEARELALRGAARLREQAACVEDVDARARFLDQVPEHRALLRAAEPG